ncbi:MAG: DUF2977 domain-containing protein [Oscillospiraceae bacterium]
MVKQITVDENNVVQCCSIGGYIKGGIDVEDIPLEVMLCPQAWKYENGGYTVNEEYEEPAVSEELTIEDLALAVAELAEMICRE